MNLSYVIFSKNRSAITKFRNLLPENIDLVTTPLNGIGAVDEEGYPCGAIVFDITLNICTVSWIYVGIKYRRKGVGRKMISALIRLIKDNNPNVRLQIPFVLDKNYEDGDQNPANNYFDFLSSDPRLFIDDIYANMCVTADECRKSELYTKLAECEPAADIYPFFETKSSAQKSYLNRMEKEGLYAVKDFKAWRESLIPGLCLCRIVKNEIRACVFVKRFHEGELYVDFINGDSRESLASLISVSFRTKEEAYRNDSLIAPLTDEMATDIFELIFKNVGSVNNMVFNISWDKDADFDEEL